MQILDPEMMRKKFRVDAAETSFFERELQHIYSKTYDVRYPELKDRMFVPVSSEAGSGATSVNYRQFDKVGQAKIIGQNARDLPRVDVFGREFIRPVRIAAISYGYTLMELRQAAMAGRPLNSMRAFAARRAIEEILDQVAVFGSAEDGIVDGFLNNANIPVTTLGAAWSTLTADQIIQTVSDAFERIAAATFGIEFPNTILLPTAAHVFISTKPRSSVSDTTIKEFLMKSFPNLTAIEPWYRLNTAGAGSTTRMVVYDRSPEKLTQEIPSEFEQLPVQEEGLEFKVPTLATTAGTAIYYPKSIDFTDEI
jgi:hypothetical protein